MPDDTTTISVRKDTRDELWQYKRGPDDTYEDALRRVLESAPVDD